MIEIDINKKIKGSWTSHTYTLPKDNLLDASVMLTIDGSIKKFRVVVEVIE